MPQDLRDQLWILDTGNDPKLAAALRTGFDVDSSCSRAYPAAKNVKGPRLRQASGKCHPSDMMTFAIPSLSASKRRWAGVPVLTCPGELFAQRVAASVCTAVGLPDLIVSDMNAYRSTAIELGRDREKIQALKIGLRQAMETSPLFDTERFTHNLENVNRQMISEKQGQSKVPG